MPRRALRSCRHCNVGAVSECHWRCLRDAGPNSPLPNQWSKGPALARGALQADSQLNNSWGSQVTIRRTAPPPQHSSIP